MEWAEQAIQILQEFVMDRDFPEGTWEHTMFMEMEESQLVRTLNDYQKRVFIVVERYR